MVLDSNVKDQSEQAAAALGQVNKMAGDVGNTFASKLGPAGDLLSKMGAGGLAAAAGIGAIVTAAMAAAKEVAAMVAQLAEHADNLDALSVKTSVSVAALQKWELAAKLGNTSTDALSGAMVKMQKIMADSPNKFDRIGVSIEELKALAPEQQFELVAQKLMAIEDPAERVAAGQAVMGKAFADNMGAMQALTSSATDLGGALDDETTAAAAALQDQLDTLGVATKRFTEQLAGIIVRTPGLVDGIGDVAKAIGSMAQTISDHKREIDYFMQFMAGYTGARGFIGTASAGASLFDTLFGADNTPGVKEWTGKGNNYRASTLGQPFMGPTMPDGTEAVALLAKGLAGDVSKAKQEMHEFERAAAKAAKAVQVLHVGFNRGSLLSGQFGAAPVNPAEMLVGRNFGALLNDQLGAAPKQIAHPVADGFRDGMKEAFRDMPALLLQSIRGGGGLGAIGGTLGGALGQSLQKPITDGLSGVLGKTLGGALGSLAPGIGGLLGEGLGKLFGGLFGGEGKKVNDMRDQQLAALGGWEKLHKQLAAAGNEGLMKKIFDAKTIDQFNAAMAQANGLLGLQSQAQNELNAAAERYGFTTQNQIEMQAGDLLKSWELLNAQQFNNTEITKAMSGDLNAYFQKAIAAGQTIPENFRPIAEQMAKLGLLTDASGNAVDTLAEAGITGFGAMTDGVKTLVEEIRKLVAVLRGVPDAMPNLGGGGGGSYRAEPGEPRRFEEGRAGGSQGFEDYGGGRRLTLHGIEGVFRPNDLQAVARMMAGMMGDSEPSGGGGGGGDVYLWGRAVGRQMARLDAAGYVRPKQQLRGRQR